MLRTGFGFVETGTVTPRPQQGIRDHGCFAHHQTKRRSTGSDLTAAVSKPMRPVLPRARQGGIVGANVGKNKETEKAEEDYVTGIERVTPLADYLVVNISSPNTEGLRDLQARQSLETLLTASLDARARSLPDATQRPPLLVKVAPDLNEGEMGDIAEVSLTTGIDGIIIGNTTLDRPETLRSPEKGEGGGLSGKPLLTKSTECLAGFWRLTEGKVPLVGCSGFFRRRRLSEDQSRCLHLLQLYTALVFHGPGLAHGLPKIGGFLKRDGFDNVADAVAADHR